MAKGQEIATFSMKSTSVTYTPGPAGSTLTQTNFEGTATGGFGTIAGTASFVGGGAGGSMSYCGAAYQDNGELLNAQGTGSYESSGNHRWRTQAVLRLSDGNALYSEGEIDLATRAWTGKVFEWS
jgi:hypothetical protein